MPRVIASPVPRVIAFEFLQALVKTCADNSLVVLNNAVVLAAGPQPNARLQSLCVVLVWIRLWIRKGPMQGCFGPT